MTPRAVFMGSPQIVVPILEAVAEAADLRWVVTQPDRPAGRGRSRRPPPVKVAADRMGIPCIQPDTLRDGMVAGRIAEEGIDIAVVAAFGRLLPPSVLQAPAAGCVNVHFSLLPRWRGAAPVQRAILAGDEETGVTLMRMDEGLDTGPILDTARTTIGAEETAGELAQRLAHIGAERIRALLATYPSLPAAAPQPSEGVTHAPRVRAEEGRIDFGQPAEAIVRRARAMTPWPGAFAFFGALRVKFSGVTAVGGMAGGGPCPVEPGTILGTSGDRLLVAARDGMVAVATVHPAGRRAMTGRAFWAGRGGGRFTSEPA